MRTASLNTAKTSIRQQIRQRRKQLSSFAQYQAAYQFSRRSSALAAFQEARNVAFYLASDGEISISQLMQKALRLGKHVYLPRVRGTRMSFHRYQKGDVLKQNKFGIPEPLPRAKRIRPESLDLAFVPLVAFDAQGRRLGMGGGFYDRCFSMRLKRFHKKPRLFGCAHACQQMNALPVESWDIPLDCIVTDVATLIPN